MPGSTILSDLESALMNVVVFVVDDDPSLRRAVIRLLNSLNYVAKAYASAGEFLHQQLPDVPSCLILDLSMPEMNGLDIQDALARRGERLPIIFLSGRGDIPTSVQAMKAGAVDFLTKPVDEQELISAVRTALERSARIRGESEALKRDKEAFTSLTPRERDVCIRIAQGLLNKQVGFELGTTEKTIKVQRARVMQKLGAASLSDVVRLVERLRTAGGLAMPVSVSKDSR
jgi:FixJ family two-component response regulator